MLTIIHTAWNGFHSLWGFFVLFSVLVLLRLSKDNPRASSWERGLSTSWRKVSEILPFNSGVLPYPPPHPTLAPVSCPHNHLVASPHASFHTVLETASLEYNCHFWKIVISGKTYSNRGRSSANTTDNNSSHPLWAMKDRVYSSSPWTWADFGQVAFWNFWDYALRGLEASVIPRLWATPCKSDYSTERNIPSVLGCSSHSSRRTRHVGELSAASRL